MLYENSVPKAPGVRLAVAGAVWVCLGGFAGGAWAVVEQTLEPVVVSATRWETPLQKAPVGATVITAVEIARSGVRDANEAVRRLGGVTGRTDLSGGRENALSLRGYGATADMNLVVLINGVRASEAQLVTPRLSAIPVDQIERIEIVRGGNSVLWGAGASAGVINVILKRDREPGLHGRVSTAVESHRGYEVLGNVSRSMGDWWVDGDFKRLDTDGYRDNSDYRQDVGSMQVAGQAGSLKWHARVQRERQKTGLPGSLTFAQFEQNPRQASTMSDRGYTDETSWSSGLEWANAATAFKVDVASRERSSRYVQSWGAYAWDSHTDQISPTLEHTFRWSDEASLQWVGGWAWERWSLSNAGSGQQFSEQSNQALFTQLNATLPTRTRISWGVRNERAVSATAYGGFSTYGREDRLHAWELGISQTLLRGTDLYVRSGRSYRLATADEYGYTAGGQPLLPQFNRDWEGGVKWSAGGRSATARVFRQNTSNEIDYDPIIQKNANLQPLRRQGVEVDVRWQWNNGWSTLVSGQALSARFLQGSLAGKQVPLVVPRTLTWRVGYEFNEQHRVDGGVQYLSPIRFNDDVQNQCARRIPSSSLVDARYEWTDKVWSASLGVTNLADRHTYNFAYSCATGALYPESGRVWRATVSRRF